MKPILALPITALILGAFTSASALELPVQKPGLWKTTMASTSMPGGARSYSMCKDVALIAASKASTDAHLKKDCSRHDLRQDGNIWTADMDCTFSGIHDVSHSVTTIQGDTYHTVLTSDMKSPGAGKAGTVMTIDAQWLGACKPGQKVGVPIR